MQTYILQVRDRRISAASGDTTMVRTSSGVDEIEVRLHGQEWLAFGLSLALSIGGSVYEVPVTAEAAADADWDAAFSVPVPDAALTHTGALGVAVHGADADGNHIITAAAWPLSIEDEGDDGQEE